MEWETRFFKNIWRFNALALAGVLVVSGLVALFALATILLDLTRDRSVSNLVDTRPEVSDTVREHVGALAPLGQTGLLWAAVTRESTSELRYASKGLSAVIDYVIYDPDSGATRFLLGRRPGLVLSTQMLVPRRPTGAPPAPAAALAVTFVAEDSDGDGRLSRRDQASLAIAAPTGEGLSIVPPERPSWAYRHCRTGWRSPRCARMAQTAPARSLSILIWLLGAQSSAGFCHLLRNHQNSQFRRDLVP